MLKDKWEILENKINFCAKNGFFSTKSDSDFMISIGLI